MKLLIDEAECNRQGVPISVALYIASLYHKQLITYNTFDETCRRGLILYDGFDAFGVPTNPRLTTQGIELAESIFLNSEFRKENEAEDRFDRLAEKLRELYPAGRKDGTSLMWRDSKAIIAQRLKTLVKKHGISFSDEQAIEATKRYVESFNGNYQFMQVLKYFIIKKNLSTGEENSQLASYIENEGSTDLNDSWRDSVR